MNDGRLRYGGMSERQSASDVRPAITDYGTEAEIEKTQTNGRHIGAVVLVA